MSTVKQNSSLYSNIQRRKPSHNKCHRQDMESHAPQTPRPGPLQSSRGAMGLSLQMVARDVKDGFTHRHSRCRAMVGTHPPAFSPSYIREKPAASPCREVSKASLHSPFKHLGLRRAKDHQSHRHLLPETPCTAWNQGQTSVLLHIQQLRGKAPEDCLATQ